MVMKNSQRSGLRFQVITKIAIEMFYKCGHTFDKKSVAARQAPAQLHSINKQTDRADAWHTDTLLDSSSYSRCPRCRTVTTLLVRLTTQEQSIRIGVPGPAPVHPLLFKFYPFTATLQLPSTHASTFPHANVATAALYYLPGIPTYPQVT